MVAAIFFMMPSFTDICAACCKRVVWPIVDDNSFLTILDLSIASTACEMAALHSLVRGFGRTATIGDIEELNWPGLGAEHERMCCLGNDNALRALSELCASV